jgi:hypothetical protein
MSCNCNCPDPEGCDQLSPIPEGYGLPVVNSENCPRLLVPVPGAVVYTDGVLTYYADGSAVRPLSFPGLVGLTATEGLAIPALLFTSNGGTIVKLTPPADDDLYIYSSGGEWVVGQLPVNASWPVGDIPEECCCPAAFAVLTLSDDETEYELKRFNPCTDSTTVESGPILTCEDGCMRKLAGTDDDQVPVWDTGTSEWVPTDISSLVPTPDSVLDIANFTYAGSGTEASMTPPYTPFNFYMGNGASWSINQSSTLLSSVAYANPGDASAQALNIINAGWYQVTVSITVNVTQSAVAQDPSLYVFPVILNPTVNNAAITGVPAFTRGLANFMRIDNTGSFDTQFYYVAHVTFAAQFTANSRLNFLVNVVGNELSGSPVVYTTGNWIARAIGTVTRIT